MSFGAIASSIGGAIGSREAAKGYGKGLDDFRQLEEEARNNRKFMDPSGAKGYRKEYATRLNRIMNGEESIEADPGYQFVYDQAMQATSRENAASGFGAGINSSGNAAIALQDRGRGLASTEYKSILDNLKDLGSAGTAAGIAAGQTYGNMMTGAAQGKAAMHVGENQAKGQSTQMWHTAGGQSVDQALSMASDARLKKNIKRIAKDGNVNIYSWEWNQLADETFGLTGPDTGYIAQEVRKVMPEAVTSIKGFLAIDYNYINEQKRVA